MLKTYLLYMFVVAAAVFITTPLVSKVAKKIGAVSTPRDRDIHKKPTARLGGLAMMLGILTLLTYSYLTGHETSIKTPDGLAILFGAAAIFAVGVLDDIFELNSVTKLSGQIAAIAIPLTMGFGLYWVPLPGNVIILDPLTGTVLTILIFLFIINAVNFIDGLDGLAAGVVFSSALGLFTYNYILSTQYGFSNGQLPATLTAITIGCCVGFYPYNAHVAKIFMGDSGSMLLGYLLAATSIYYLQKLPAQAVENTTAIPAWLALALPLVSMILPVADLIAVALKRLKNRQSVMKPDKNHFHHHLLNVGHSHHGAVLLMYLISFYTTAMIILALYVPLTTVGAVTAMGYAAGAAAYILYRNNHSAVENIGSKKIKKSIVGNNKKESKCL